MNPLPPESEAVLVAQLNEWLDAKEGEHFEFKKAENRSSYENLAKYCCAMANEGGGRVILGVTNNRPRRVVGTRAFSQPERTRSSLMDHLHLRVDFLLISHPKGRVLVFESPSRPVGTVVKYDGVYWSREGDSLVPMSEDRLRNIFAETGHDFSADVCPSASNDDLDSAAVEDFRRRWIEKSRNSGLASLSLDQLLRDAELVSNDGITYAALVLFATRQALGKHLAQAEVIFEYRSSGESGPAQQRKEHRQGFFSFYDDLWNGINLRNDLQHYVEGLFVFVIPTFAERPIREAILNAVSHRDYQLGGSVFVRQYPRRLVVESPGGLPVGITLENILDRQSPRNRRIAEVLAKCGMVERSGQGVNLMFEQSIAQGKPRPDFSGTDTYNVVITLNGQVTDPRFVEFLEKVGRETSATFDAHDFVILDLVHREAPVPPVQHSRLRRLVALGIVETLGRGKGTRYLLSRRFYSMIGGTGTYTRRKGLDDETHKELLLKHLRESAAGSPLSVLCQVLPQLSTRKVQVLLRDLREEGRILLEGSRRWARWKAAKDKETPQKG